METGRSEKDPNPVKAVKPIHPTDCTKAAEKAANRNRKNKKRKATKKSNAALHLANSQALVKEQEKD